METSNSQPFLFVDCNVPTRVRRHDKVLERNIRRHVMVDIGKARRKPPRNPQFDLKMPLSHADETIGEKCRDPNDSAKSYRRPWPESQLMRPFWDQHPLTVLEQQWGMDEFSAYGIILLMKMRKNPEGTDNLGSNFCVPFAFKESNFLHHLRPMIYRPEVLEALYWESPAKFRSMALERSMGTIACLRARLAKPDSYEATCNDNIRAVLAIICYNLINLELEQARVHMKGLELMIATRGGISCLKGDDELRLMVFWVDVTASLLYNRRPRFSLPSYLIPTAQSIYSDLPTTPLSNIMKVDGTRDESFMYAISCMADLDTVATLIQSDLLARGDALWEDVEQVSLRVNPVTHRLFDDPKEPGIPTPSTAISKALRLGAIIWIIWMKRRCRSYPATAAAYVSQLLSLLSNHDEWSGVPTSPEILVIRLWLLVICGISSSGPTERENVVDMIIQEMQQQGLDNWGQVLLCVCQMPWVSVFETPCAELGEHIQGSV